MMPTRMNLAKRLEREILSIEEEALRDPDPDVTAQLVENDLRHWIGRIKGPLGTPYEGGFFFLDIVIPDEYPYAPPKIRFDTRVWHPNVSSQTGAICLDILKNEWSPALTMRTTLLSIEALLSSPEPNDPQDNEVATMYKRDISEFNAKAKEWVNQYASRKNWPFETKAQTLTEMGVPYDKAVEALKKHKWDVNAAANECFGEM